MGKIDGKMSVSDKEFGNPTANDMSKTVSEDEVERQLGDVDPVAEGKLVRKLDLYLVPVVMLLYLLSFLDR